MTEDLLGKDHGYENREVYWKKWVQENNNDIVAKKLVKLEHNSNYDNLTGLLNRRGLEERVAYIAELVKSRGSTLSFLFIDVDGLKSINDNQGHSVGDKALMEVARAVSTRGADSEGRWGGDEFLVLLPDSNKDGALVVVERIISNLKGALTTVSIGVGEWDKLKDLVEAIKEAEKSMYQFKQSGLRNGERSKGIGVVTLE